MISETKFLNLITFVAVDSSLSINLLGGQRSRIYIAHSLHFLGKFRLLLVHLPLLNLWSEFEWVVKWY